MFSAWFCNVHFNLNSIPFMKCLLKSCTKMGLKFVTNPQKYKCIILEGILTSILPDPFALYIRELVQVMQPVNYRTESNTQVV